jgi:hypothetical protein
MAAAMPEPEEAEREKQQWQEDDVAGCDEEDQQRDRQPDRECADHSPQRLVGDVDPPSPTSLNRLVVRTP